jgi:hypothetical protein
MAIKCPQCGVEYDVTLFTFDRRVRCDCGQWVDLAVGHQQTSEDGKQGPKNAVMPCSTEERRKEETKLLAAIKDALPRLEQMWQQANSHWGYEDPVYRFYHQSFKVFGLQAQTAEIVSALQALAPHIPLNPWFMQIVDEGAAEQFSPEVNQRWVEATRPILEAFFHARYFLEMICMYGRELEEPPDSLPSGWAAVLYLYGLR